MQGEDDEEFLGYCSLQETYVQWISLNSGRSILLICNGSDKVSLYFENDGVWRDLRPKIACNIVQIDFKSNYHLGKEIGQGSFSKVF